MGQRLNMENYNLRYKVNGIFLLPETILYLKNCLKRKWLIKQGLRGDSCTTVAVAPENPVVPRTCQTPWTLFSLAAWCADIRETHHFMRWYTHLTPGCCTARVPAWCCWHKVAAIILTRSSFFLCCLWSLLSEATEIFLPKEIWLVPPQVNKIMIKNFSSLWLEQILLGKCIGRKGKIAVYHIINCWWAL